LVSSGIAVSMMKIIRPRNVLLALTLLAQCSYRTNYYCEPGDHPIQSEADAIAVAKRKIVERGLFGSESFGSVSDFVDAVERTEDCCHAIRSRNILGFITWDVYLGARMRPSARLYPGMPTDFFSHSVLLDMSNCGSIATENSYKIVD
jgi:hypothetical protein